MSPTQARCRSCSALILWVESENRKPMPLDHDPTPTGNVTIATSRERGCLVGFVLTDDDPRRTNGSQVLYTSHFATCPDGPTWRKRK